MDFGENFHYLDSVKTNDDVATNRGTRHRG